MIDFHTHILPKMDDGSKSVEESVSMLERMQEQGVSTVVATPHFDMRNESLQSFLARREVALEKMSAAPARNIRIVPGAEVMYCGVPLHLQEGIEKACIGKGRYLLIETLMVEWDDEFRTDLQYLMMERNIIPVLAHIERYYFSRKNRTILRALKKDGVLLQMNAEFFLKKGLQRLGFKILRKEGVHVLGSDSHNISVRPPNLGDAVAVIRKRMGQETVMQLMSNANHILTDCR